MAAKACFFLSQLEDNPEMSLQILVSFSLKVMMVNLLSKLGYSKCSKISNTFLILISNKMLIFRTGIHKILVRIANSEDPD